MTPGALKLLADGALLVLSAAALATALVLLAQVALAVLGGRRCRLPSRSCGPLAVLVPARGDVDRLAATITELRRQVRPGDLLLAVRVAGGHEGARALAAARAAGAYVSPVAGDGGLGAGGGGLGAGGGGLAGAVRSLAARAPAAVVLVDPGARPSVGAVATLAAHAVALGRPVRADLHHARPGDDPGRVAAFALLGDERVRARARAALGLPVALSGGVVALPWSVAHAAASGLGTDRGTDRGLGTGLDLDLGAGPGLGTGRDAGVELALLGAPPALCVRCRVAVPCVDEAASSPPVASERAGAPSPRAPRGGDLRRLVDLARLGLRAGRPELALHALDLVLGHAPGQVAQPMRGPSPGRRLASTLVAAALAAWAVAEGRSPLPLALSLCALAALGAGAGILRAWARRLGLDLPADPLPRGGAAGGRAGPGAGGQGRVPRRAASDHGDLAARA